MYKIVFFLLSAYCSEDEFLKNLCDLIYLGQLIIMHFFIRFSLHMSTGAISQAGTGVLL